MRFLLVLLFLSPLQAELREVVLHYQPTDCASCTLSLPERFQRIRGVEAVRQNAEAKTLSIQLTAGNRVRLSRLHESLQQDGTKLLKTEVTGTGECSRGAGGQWTYQPHASDGTYAIEAPPGVSPGACSLKSAQVR